MQSIATANSTRQIERSFFPTLRNLAFLSFAFLAGATVLGQSPWIATLGGVAPLIWYHLVYLAPRARTGLSQAAIDSVYYFGFLITIAALGVSALSLALGSGAESMDTIAHQFGLGLLATGYAVFARMHLTSISTWLDEQTPEGLLDRYLQRTQELVTNVELASVQFATLSSNLIARTEAVTKNASDTTEKAMLQLARVFDEQLRATLASGNQGLSDLRALVNETSFAEEREALARSIKVTLEAVLHLNKALLELTSRSAEQARSSDLVRINSDLLATNVAQLSRQIENVAGEEGTLARSIDAFASVQSKATDATHTLTGVVEELTEVGGALAGVGTTFRALKTVAPKIHAQLDSLGSSAAQLDVAAVRIGQSAQSANSLAEGLERLNAVLPILNRGVEGASGKLKELEETTAAVESHLQSVPRPAETAIALTNDLRNAIVHLHAILAKAGAEAGGLAGATANVVSALEKAERFAAEGAALQLAAKNVNELLSSLVTNAATTTTSLSVSAEEMKKTISAATIALERDVQVSSRAASLFAQRLADVAQGIIDETRKARAV